MILNWDWIVKLLTGNNQIKEIEWSAITISKLKQWTIQSKWLWTQGINNQKVVSREFVTYEIGSIIEIIKSVT